MTTLRLRQARGSAGVYRLEDRIAAGSGVGCVEAIGRDARPGCHRLHVRLGISQDRRLLLTAARAASRLTDPAACQVFDVEDAWDQAYIVMEWGGR